jgi:protein SCO1/2
MPESLIDGRFELVDHDGHVVSEKSYRGRWMLVFFGFTHCRMVCPRALQNLSDALGRLGDLRDGITPLYVTVDPERDTPEVMRKFLAERDSPFVGLTGSREQVDAAKAGFRVFAQRSTDPEDVDGYAVPHSAMTYLLDPQGEYVDHFLAVADARDLAARLQDKLASAS